MKPNKTTTEWRDMINGLDIPEPAKLVLRQIITQAISSTKQEERERINKILLEKMPDALHNYGAYILNNKETQPLERRAMKKSMTEAFIKVYFLTTLKER